MKLGDKVARRIARRMEKFAAHWAALDDARREDAAKVVVMVELVGGRDKAATLLRVSDNTIDNHRKGSGDIKHVTLRELTEHAGLPPAALFFRWQLEDGELLFADEEGRLVREPGDLDRPGARFQDDVPPFAYVPGHDEVMRPAGLAEEGALPHLAVPLDYLDHLGPDPRNLVAMVAQDDGMVPEIEQGALLLVDVSDKQLTEGCVYVFDGESGPILRRIRRLPNGSLELLCADDQRHPPRRIAKADIGGLDTIGRLRSHSRVV